MRNSIAVEALRSRFDSVDVLALTTPGQEGMADPDAILIRRPAPPSRAQAAASLRRGGVYFAPAHRLDLESRLEELVGAGRLRDRYDLVWAQQSLMAGAALSLDASARVLDVDTVVGRVMVDRAAAVRSPLGRLYGRLHAAAVAREERRRWSRFDHLVVASEG